MFMFSCCLVCDRVQERHTLAGCWCHISLELHLDGNKKKKQEEMSFIYRTTWAILM